MGSPSEGISQGVLRCGCGEYATIQMFGVDYCDAHAPEPHDLEREVEVLYWVQITRVVCHDCDTASEWRVDDSPVPGLDGTALSEILPCMQLSISRPIEIRPVPGSDDVWEIVREVDPAELEDDH